MPDTGRRGRRVSAAEFKRLWDDKSLSLADIGRALDISTMAVLYRARHRGYGPRERPAPELRIVLDDDLFPFLCAADATQRDIASYYGVKHFTVYRAAKRLGIEWRVNSKIARPSLAEAVLKAKLMWEKQRVKT